MTLTPAAEQMVRTASLLVAGTLALAQPTSGTTLLSAVSAAKAKAKEDATTTTTLLLDVNWRPVFWADPTGAIAKMAPLVAAADIVKLTDEEAEWLLGVDAGEALTSPEVVEAKLREEMAPNLVGVLVTAGEKGAAYSFRSGQYRGFQEVFDVPVVDTTGAGDAFTAGFACRLLQGEFLMLILSVGKERGDIYIYIYMTGEITTR